MRDLALDPETGDLLLANGAARLTVPGVEATRQRLLLRLATWRGEYELDTRVGIPYSTLLGRKGATALLASTLRTAAATCPGVDALLSFELTVNADRTAAVTLEARTIEGDVLTLEDVFIVENDEVMEAAA